MGFRALHLMSSNLKAFAQANLTFARADRSNNCLPAVFFPSSHCLFIFLLLRFSSSTACFVWFTSSCSITIFCLAQVFFFPSLLIDLARCFFFFILFCSFDSVLVGFRLVLDSFISFCISSFPFPYVHSHASFVIPLDFFSLLAE